MRQLAGLLLCSLLATGAEVPSGWKYSQTVALSQTGFVKFALPPEIMNGSKADLRDLRLFSASGKETPYLVETPTRPSSQVQPVRKVNTTIRDRLTLLDIETGVDQPIGAVLLDSPVLSFMKSATVEASSDGKSWQTLAQAKPLFRLDNGAAETTLSFAPMIVRLLRITISDERSGPIPFANIRVLSRPVDLNPPRSLPAKAAPQEDAAGVSRIEIHLGAANVFFSEIELRATEPFYTRNVSVVAPRVRGNEIVEDQIAAGEIHRIALDERMTSENRTLSVERQVGSESITLLIRNNDAPAIHFSEIEVRYRPYVTALYVEETGAYVWATGNGQATAPKYEMDLVRGDLAKLKITDALLGPLTPNPNYREPETLPGIAEKGALVDLKPWKFRKQIQSSGPGVYQIQLDPETLSLATPGLQDLRVVQNDTQLPFLLERVGTVAELVPRWGATNLPNRASVSAWLVVLPFEALPINRLIARVENPLFQRTVTVYDVGEGGGESERRFLGQSTWVHKPGQTNVLYSIELNAMPRSNRLLVETDNGDNPPISIQSLKITYPITRVLFKAPSNPALYLYFGNAEAHVPQYDLAIVGEQFITAEHKPGALGSLEHLQRVGVKFSSSGTSTVFWVALVAVVAGLLFVVSRLLPRDRV